MKRKWVGRVLILSMLVAGFWGCSSGGGSQLQPQGQLVALEVTPADSTIAVNTGRQFIATGIYADFTKKDLTGSVTWSSSDTSIAVISGSTGTTVSPALSAPGTVYGTGEGTATITAIYGGGAALKAAGSNAAIKAAGGISGSATLKVKRAKLVSIAVTPTNPSAVKGTSQQFVATGTFSDNTTQDLTTTVTWSSSNTTVASVSNTAGSAGLASALAPGTTTVTAAWTSISGSTALTVTPATLVSVQVTPANPAIAKGSSEQFTATGVFSDNTTQNLTASVTWSSSDTTVADISNAAGSNGLAAGAGAGTTTISATYGTVSGSTTLTVNATALVSITVTPANPAIAKGTTQQFTATGNYSDNTAQNLTASVIWSSSNTSVAAISNAAGSNGLATGMAAGSATITAASGSISGSTTLTVNPATLASLTVTPLGPSIADGTKQQFTATGTYSDGSTQTLTGAVTWSSSNSAVATISNAGGSNGLATSLAAGSATIKAASGSIAASTTLTVNPAVLTSIAVTPVNPSIAAGSKQQFIATGTYSDGSTQNLTTAVTWSSSNTAVATISNAAGSNGLATSVAAGTSTITAVSGSISGSTTLTVTTGTAGLAWDATTTNTDGTAITDLGGYKVHYGTSSGNYTSTIDVGNVLSYSVTGLAPGTYYFAVTAYNTGGTESTYSNEASKTIQ